ncbi:hypothetical protein [Prevotella sp. HUN102]|uniref:hypothetical protein n=1 Tax=Prevotella sp. HUN102 TaxID=1392486 RepID=UPI0004901AC6|nr:hypothetical protein [Prevotella sp. HUN102]
MNKIKGYVWGIVICAVITVLSGCGTKYVPVETRTTDTVYKARTDSVATRNVFETRYLYGFRDSIRIRDSVRIRVNERGEEIGRDTWHREFVGRSEREFSGIRNERDFYKAKADSLQALRSKYKEVPKVVERKLNRWERLKMDVGGVAIGVSLIFVLFVIRWIVRAVRGRI